MLKVNIQCLAHEDSVFYINELCRNTLELIQFPEERKVLYAIHEVVINSIEATEKRYGKNHKQSMTVAIKTCKEEVEVIVGDAAGGFEECDNKDFSTSDLFSERGRGFLFIKHFMDEVLFENKEDGLFYVILKKRLQTEEKANEQLSCRNCN